MSHRRRSRARRARSLPRRLTLELLEDRQLLAGMVGPANIGADLPGIVDEYNAFITGGGTPEQFVSSRASEFFFEQDRIFVEARSAAPDFATFTTALQGFGFQITASSSAYGVAEGYLSIPQITTAASDPAVRAVLPNSAVGITDARGAVGNQAEQLLRADQLSSLFNLDGTGVTIGVISDSATRVGGGLAASQATGDLPNNVQVLIPGPISNVVDEGRAMMELIYDIAPGATLLFASGAGGDASMAAAINALVAAGADIIVDDLNGLLSEPFYQDGAAATAVNNAVAAGVAYFSSAGNRGAGGFDTDANFAGTATVNGVSANFHDFDLGAGTDRLLSITLPVGENRIIFQYDQPFGGVVSDLDIQLFSTAGASLATSTTLNTATQVTREVATFNNTTGAPLAVDLAVSLVSGSAPRRFKIIIANFDGGLGTINELQFQTGAFITAANPGHNGSQNSISIAAVPFSNLSTVEPFSSIGPVTRTLAPDGNAFPTLLIDKPILAAVDGVNNTFFGADSALDPDTFPNFFGTSAAAPNAAAVAALLLQLNPALTPSQLRAALVGGAQDIGAPGFDQASGFGLIDAVASAVFLTNGVVTIDGDQDAANQDDTFVIRRNATDNSLVEVIRSGTFVGAAPLASVTQIQFNGLGGNDTLIVDSSNGLVAILNGVRFDGGVGFDQVNLLQTGGPAIVSDSLAIGATPGAGRSTVSDGAITQRIDFTNLEPFFDVLPAPSFQITSVAGIASLLQADNAINYEPSQILVGGGRVTVDNFEPIEFINKASLIIDAGAGSDTIHLNHPGVPVGLTSIVVNGGDPTGSDTLIVNGIAGAVDDLVVNPTATGSGTVTEGPLAAAAATAAFVPVTFTGTEHLTVVGQSTELDGLRAGGTTGNDTAEYTPGATPDAGRITGFTTTAPAFTFTPIEFKGFLGYLVLSSAVINTGGTDTAIVNGSGADDAFVFGTGTTTGLSDPAVTVTTSTNTTHAQVYFGDSVAIATLRGLAGNDSLAFAPVTAGLPAVAIRFEGGDSDPFTDTVNYTATAGATTNVNLATSTIAQTAPAGNPLTYNGVERVNLVLSGAASALAIGGTVGDDEIDLTPTAAGQGSFKVSSTGAFVGISPQFTYTGVDNGFTVNGAGGFDTLGLIATAANDVIDMTQTSPTALSYRQNAFTQVFAIAELEAARIAALAGNDLIRVAHADAFFDGDNTNGTPDQMLRFEVDGGTPNASDRLIVRDDGVGDLVLVRQAPDSRSGRVTVNPVVNTFLGDVVYQNIERLDISPIDPITGGTGEGFGGRVVVFQPDEFEFNDTRLVATDFSDVSTTHRDPNIDPGAVFFPFPGEVGAFGLPPDGIRGDEDWYEFRPDRTSTFRFNVRFTEIATVASGRPGLPGNGNLDIAVYDSSGTLVATGVAGVGFAGEQVAFGAQAGTSYFLRVKGAALADPFSFAINTYDLDIVDTDRLGPQITDIFVTGFPNYDLFDPKPSTDGPTPLVESLTIRVQDLPPRAPGFLYPALNETIAENPGNYLLVGDFSGVIPISTIDVINDPIVIGQPATATIIITFVKPLPDDRFTLTIRDGIVDPPGNKLDGESNNIEPLESPLVPGLPSGDTNAGGNFVARFTVDTRPEIGVWAAGIVHIDTNGNFFFDPEALDFTNRDLIYTLGFSSDYIFAGNFASPGPNLIPGDGDDLPADRFDKLAVYGRVGSQWRFLIDVTNDGVPDLVVPQSLAVNGIPVAGNFDGNKANGDEVGVFTGTTWHFDTNHDFQLDSQLAANGYTGFPIVGDFNGDGLDDLGTYQASHNANIFSIVLATAVGVYNSTPIQFRVGIPGLGTFGFPGVRERPVAADMNGDGVDDLGLWVPDGTSIVPGDQGEWFFLLSEPGRVRYENGGDGAVPRTVIDRIVAGSPVNFVPFSTTPFGQDLYARFGNSFALPIVGNFDPPHTSTASTPKKPAPTTAPTTTTTAPKVTSAPAAKTTTTAAAPQTTPAAAQSSTSQTAKPAVAQAIAPAVPAASAVAKTVASTVAAIPSKGASSLTSSPIQTALTQPVFAKSSNTVAATAKVAKPAAALPQTAAPVVIASPKTTTTVAAPVNTAKSKSSPAAPPKPVVPVVPPATTKTSSAQNTTVMGVAVKSVSAKPVAASTVKNSTAPVAKPLAVTKVPAVAVAKIPPVVASATVAVPAAPKALAAKAPVPTATATQAIAKLPVANNVAIVSAVPVAKLASIQSVAVARPLAVAKPAYERVAPVGGVISTTDAVRAPVIISAAIPSTPATTAFAAALELIAPRPAEPVVPAHSVALGQTLADATFTDLNLTLADVKLDPEAVASVVAFTIGSGHDDDSASAQEDDDVTTAIAVELLSSDAD